jgi:hypothetical protein
MEDEKDITHPTDAELLVEYQAAQNSAQHHDTLIWSINSVVWSASLILLGLLLKSSPDRNMIFIVSLISLLGIFLIIKVWIYTSQLAELKRQKYDRCKEIEQRFGFKQHTTVIWKSGRQWFLYSVVMIFFIIIWLTVAWSYLMPWLCQCR